MRPLLLTSALLCLCTAMVLHYGPSVAPYVRRAQSISQGLQLPCTPEGLAITILCALGLVGVLCSRFGR